MGNSYKKRMHCRGNKRPTRHGNDFYFAYAIDVSPLAPFKFGKGRVKGLLPGTIYVSKMIAAGTWHAQPQRLAVPLGEQGELDLSE